jgi:hypothetical protein
VSLVSDALKKAQREAAARQAREKGLPEQLMDPGQPYRARRRGGRGTLAFAVAAALAVGAALAWFFVARPPAAPEAASQNAPAPPAAANHDPAQTAAAKAPMKGGSGTATAVSAQGPAPASAAPDAPRTDASAASEAVPAGSPSLENEERVAEPVPSRAASARSPAAPEPRPGERSFAREARLDDGVELRLSGIAWSDVAPLAYLNGRLLGVGESLSGWTIEAIERDGVRLSGAGGTIRISLR